MLACVMDELFRVAGTDGEDLTDPKGPRTQITRL